MKIIFLFIRLCLSIVKYNQTSLFPFLKERVIGRLKNAKSLSVCPIQSKMSFSIFHYFGTLTFINITVRGSELRPRKKITNYGYAFVGNSQMLTRQVGRTGML